MAIMPADRNADLSSDNLAGQHYHRIASEGAAAAIAPTTFLGVQGLLVELPPDDQLRIGIVGKMRVLCDCRT